MPDTEGRKRKRVAIVGFCETSRNAVPYDDPEMEIWGLNRGYMFMPRADRWFEMHGQNIYTAQERRPGRHLEWLNNFGGPVYMHQQFDDVKTCVVFPLQALADDVGHEVLRLGRIEEGKWVDQEAVRDTCGEPYLSSSIAYEIALAIYERFEEIYLYGIDLNTESEYAWQKPGVEFLLGVAAGRGIKVYLPDNCPLLKGTLYGRSFMSPKPEVMGYEQMKTRRAALEHDMRGLEQQHQQLVGALRELQYILDQMPPGLDHEMLDGRRKAMQAEINKLGGRIAQVVGAINEDTYWQHQTMPGQDPAEALQQLRTLDSDGPVSVAEVLMRPEPVFHSFTGSVVAEPASAPAEIELVGV